MISAIRAWHAQELQKDYALQGRMVMGCPLWGEDFTTHFLEYCLPSIAANQLTENEEVSLVLFTDKPTAARVAHLFPAGWVKILPDEIANRLPTEGHWKYPLLAACHNLLIHKARDSGAGFHMLVADSVYSKDYFENLLMLSRRQSAIAHTGFAIVGHTGLPRLDDHRQAEMLVLSAQDLGALGFEHLNPQWASWNMDGIDSPFDMMPNSHYIHWRTKDAVHIHCAHQSAAWISNERCQHVTPHFGGTVDSELPRYLAGDFYTPTLEDEMTYVVIAGSTTPTPRIPFDAFKSEFWRFIGSNREFLPYFMNGVAVPVAHDPDAIDVGEYERRLHSLMQRLNEPG